MLTLKLHQDLILSVAHTVLSLLHLKFYKQLFNVKCVQVTQH